MSTRFAVAAVLAGLAVPAAAPAATPAPYSASGFGQMTGIEQLQSIAAQTGGGHLAIISGKRYVRMPSGKLVRLR